MESAMGLRIKISRFLSLAIVQDRYLEDEPA